MTTRSTLTACERHQRQVLAGLSVLAVALLFGVPSAEAARGGLDPTFSQDGRVVNPDLPPAEAALVADDGSIVTVATRKRSVLVGRYFPDGELQDSFESSLSVPEGAQITFAYIRPYQAPDGALLIGVAVDPVSDQPGDQLQRTYFRLFPDGSVDSSFGGGTGKVELLPQEVGESVIDGNGRIVYYDRNARGLRRLSVDGSPDQTFAGDGLLEVPGTDSFAPTSDGGIVVGYVAVEPGTSTQTQVVKFRADGTQDMGFGGDGSIESNGTGVISPDRAASRLR